jgi:hypothetical protein
MTLRGILLKNLACRLHVSIITMDYCIFAGKPCITLLANFIPCSGDCESIDLMNSNGTALIVGQWTLLGIACRSRQYHTS